MKKILIIIFLSLAISDLSLAETVLITGANKGIGLALVKEYLQRDSTVFATVRNIKLATELQKLKNENLHIIEVDLLDEKSVGLIQAAVKDQAIDIIIHNAGLFPYAAHNPPKLDSKEWSDAFLVNAIRPTQISLALQSNLKKTKNPKVIAISSRRGSFAVNAQDNYAGRFGYRTSKAAMNAAMQALALDFKTQGITVLILHPGRVATDLTKHDGIPTAESAGLIAKVIKDNDLINTGSYIDVTTSLIIGW